MAKKIQTFADTTNVALLNAIRNSNGSDYQNRVTPATQAGIRDTAQEILGHRPTYNAFVDALINRIGSVIIRNKSWTNPLAEFKRGMLEYGDTIEEIATGLVKSKEYSPDREYLERDIFGTERPHVEANFHRVNRQEYYKITVNEMELRKAFLSSTGLYEFVNNILDMPVTSDNWDEFLMMCQLFSQYEQNGGYHRLNVPDARSIEAGGDEAKEVIRKIRATAENLTFIDTKYNAARMPVAAKRDDLVLFGTPEFFATMDVEALAGAFNIEKMSVSGRQITIPHQHFGIDGAQAILTTRDFFVVADQALENTSAENPVGLTRNYFLHHWSVISQSRFAPAVLFHTGADDSAPITITEPTGVGPISVTTRQGENVPASTDVARGSVLIASAEVTPENASTTAVRWSISGAEDPRTRITQNGTVHVGGRETSGTLVVTASTTFINPVDPADTTVHSATRNISVDLDSQAFPAWPNTDRPGDDTGDNGEGS